MGAARKHHRLAALAGMFVLFCVVTAGAAAGGSWYAARAATGVDQPFMVGPDFVRIQVVANSDTEADQMVKALVRDTLRDRLTDPALELKSSEQALAFARASLPDLEAAVRACLEAQKCTYDCVLSVGTMKFPAKSYGGVVVPPGEYPALRVSLGQSQGANWWCVLFPPLCFVDVGTSLAPDRAGVLDSIQSAMTDEEIAAAVRTALDQPGGPGNNSVRVRSWLLEKIQDSGWWARVWQGFKSILATGAHE